jgi:hypothetical protein
MRDTLRRLPALVAVALPVLAGCGAERGGDGALGTAVQREIDGGNKHYMPYSLTCSNAQDTGYIDAINATGYASTDNGRAYDIDASSEYWNFVGDLWTGITGATSHRVTLEFSPGSAADFPSSGPLPDFADVSPVAETSNPVSSLTWTDKGTTGPTEVYCNGSLGVAVGFKDLVLSGGTFTGTIDWWYMGASAPTSAFIPSTSDTGLSWVPSSTYATNAGSGEYWWEAQSTVTSTSLP